jgi:hypothetical protein|nr:MAG TPA: Head protein [Caudoviricetes sp.]
MPTKPRIATNTNISADIINAVKNSASTYYKDYVPYVTTDAESLRGIGAIIMNNPALENEFLSALVNRIAFARIASRLYTNPLATLKKGVIDIGETVEDIFVNIAKVYQYGEIAGTGADTATNLFKKYEPDVRSAFYIMNSQLTYPVTVNRAMLKSAFKSWSGMDELISGIIQSVYTAAAYDEFNVTKYLIGQHILNGKLAYYRFDDTSADKYKLCATQMRKASNDFQFMSTDYNIAGVTTFTDSDKKVILINTDYDANIDTNVLAAAFQLPYADYLNRRILIDGLGHLDIARLNKIFANDPTYQEPSVDDMAFLDKVAGVIIDEDFVQIYDTVFEMRDMPVANTLDHNYFLHMWQTYAVSPFANAVAVIPNNLVAVQTTENTSIGNLPYNTAVSHILSGTPAVGTNVAFLLTADVSTVKGGCHDLIWSLKSDNTGSAVVYPNGYITFKTIEKTNNYYGSVKVNATVRGTNIVKEFTITAGNYTA